MVTVPYYNDPHQQAYFDYLNYMARREREEEERKRQEEEGGGGWGAGIGAGAGALGGFLVGGPIGAGIGASIGGKAGGAIGTAIDPPGGPVGAARNQAWQQGIGTLTDLGVTAATWADMQAPHEAPGTAPSFMETYAAQQGRGGLGGLYAERRRSERQMGLLQERDRARQQYIDSMRGVGYEVVPSGRAIQDRYDDISAILKNEANLSPLQQEQALSVAAQKPLDMTVRRVQPTPDDLWGQNTRFDPDSGELYEYTMRNGSPSWGQLSDNAKAKQAELKYIGETQKRAQEMLLDEAPADRKTPPTAWEIEKKTAELMEAAERRQKREPLPPQPTPKVIPGAGPGAEQLKPQGMGWYDRAKLGMDMARSMAAGAPQQPGPPGQQAPPGPDQMLAQLDAWLAAESDVSKWPNEQKAQAEGILETLFGALAEAKAAQDGKLTDDQKTLVRRLRKVSEEL